MIEELREELKKMETESTNSEKKQRTVSSEEIKEIEIKITEKNNGTTKQKKSKKSSSPDN